ncbi:MAG TPA: hypothetical protein VJI74_02305 [Candidatus Paceibacterota bacterium]|uniref:Uncharacterized protein n=1 Tax=Candidatus Lloydbacteria bacterium RIFCSPHIGHO2_02_FULL_50_13 TaxID=1798661 RepID=A0A1G2D1C7_9BACT|nr:MAG: hypothetical protein A3D65_06425 [Candidatus Lloydbacteria bacterium RIFCSPHIGHO2_02_FULL_50_13]
MEQDQVKRVLIPNDPGFADGGGKGTDIFFAVMRFFDWMFHPIRMMRERKAAQRMCEELRQAHLREGKNPDGSYYREFPPLASLAEVLEELGYTVAEMRGIDQEQLRMNIVALSDNEITEAISYCQVARW